VESLLGDPSKAHHELGWKPVTTFEEMVAEMVEHDLQEAKRDALVEKHGFNSYQYHES
jgi:GDPmannose 4,6-dehydratase